MSDFKTLLALTEEARIKDQSFVDSITAEILTAIDAANTAETEYKVIYDINLALAETDGALQTTRIKNYFLEILKAKGYRASLGMVEIEPFVSEERLIITWVIATLTTSL